MARVKTASVEFTFNQFPYMRKAVKQEIERAVKERGEEIVREARRIVPVRTGRLRDSMVVGKASRDYVGDPARIAVDLTSDAPYWGYVEYRTRHMAARPYIRPAVEWGQYYLSERIGEAIVRATMRRTFYRPWEEP